MSTTELYAINEHGDVTAYGSAANSWLGGMHVWNKLNEKYGFNDSLMSQFETTWGMFNKGYYEKYEDVLLGSTFDKVVVFKQDFEKLISNFEKYLSLYPESNFDEQIRVIKRMQADENVIGMAWCQTSVADDLWDYGYDEDTDEIIPYNIYKGVEHWSLFEVLERARMNYKLIDVRNEKEENVTFGTCELCMRTGTNYYEVYVVQDETGKQYEFESGYWCYGDYTPYLWGDIHNVIQFAEWFGKQDLPEDLEDDEFWGTAGYYVYNVQGEGSE